MLNALSTSPRRNQPWTPFQRRTWLTNQRRKHRLQPAPVLRAAFPDLLQWDWFLPNPFKWNVWMSMDGGNNYILIEDYWGYGDARQFAPDGGGELYYIVGIDDTGREITKHSNIIRPDDAPLPEFVGFPDYGESTGGYDMTANEVLLHFNGDLADTSGNGLDVAPYDGGSWFGVHYGQAADIGFDSFLGNASGVNFDWAGGRSETNPDWSGTDGTTVIFWVKISYSDTPADDGFNQPIICFCSTEFNLGLVIMGGIPFQTDPPREPTYVTLNLSHGTYYGICEFSVRKYVWNQIAIVSLDGNHQVYVNGILTAENITEDCNTDSGVRFGGWYDDNQMSISPAVELAEFAVFNRAMEAEELAAINQLQTATL